MFVRQSLLVTLLRSEIVIKMIKERVVWFEETHVTMQNNFFVMVVSFDV